MKKNGFWSAYVLVIILAVLCLALAVLLAVAKPVFLLIALGAVVLLAAVLVIWLRRVRSWLYRLLGGRLTAGSLEKSAFASLGLPLAVADRNGRIIWSNAAFTSGPAQGMDIALTPLEELFPGVVPANLQSPQGQDIEVNGAHYTVYGGEVSPKTPLCFAVFLENTTLKHEAREYRLSRPAVLYFVIDTYEYLLKEMRESDRARLIARVDRLLEKYVESEKGLIRKLDASRYMALVEDRAMQNMLAGRFTVLADARHADPTHHSISLSIGVGRLGATLQESEAMAARALDMALGRGGNQAAVQSPQGYEFFGGVSASIEKGSKVRSRVVAASLAQLAARYQRVLIMGHRYSDMDSVGAAVGMWRFFRRCGCSPTIVLQQNATLAGRLLAYLREHGYGDDIMSPDTALPLAGDDTLLVVVDTHVPHLLESPAIYKKCNSVVVIDHHRKMVGHIDNALVFHHDLYVSSTSELVSEMLQQMPETPGEGLQPPEADALLAGILLDTRNFALRAGVNTFEAAAYLRGQGARTEVAKGFFNISMQDYMQRSLLVGRAEVRGGYAVVLGGEIPADADLVAAQTANDLLTIDGVKASVVAVPKKDCIQVSARSMGAVNVQLIMEKLGGGGHMTMAAAQLPEPDMNKAAEMIYAAIRQYEAEHTLR